MQFGSVLPNYCEYRESCAMSAHSSVHRYVVNAWSGAAWVLAAPRPSVVVAEGVT